MSDVFRIEPSGQVLGARVLGIDLSEPIDDATRDGLLDALATHGVLCFPTQHLSALEQKAFSARFGSLEINVASASFQAKEAPEVMTLSNVRENGQPIGLADAGQGWHTDMSYSATFALATVLHALEVPSENGHTLGATQFASQYAAYDGLPADIKTVIEARSAVHDFEKFWEMMRREKGSSRPPLSEAQRRKKPPVPHPLVITHPVSGRKALYANPGYTVRIVDLPQEESDRVLGFLFEHQLKDEYRYQHEWQVGDLLMWDDIATVHNAVADYGPSQRRVMRRCQVMADRVFAHQS